MGEVQCLGRLAAEANEEHRAAETTAHQALAHAIRCGELLHQAKQNVDHGQWAAWLEGNFEGSARTAQLYMRLHENRHRLANPQRAADLSIRRAAALLAEPAHRPGDRHLPADSKPEWTAPPAPEWLPTRDRCVVGFGRGDWMVLDMFLVTPHASDGYFFVTLFKGGRKHGYTTDDDGHVEGLRRGVAGRFVEETLDHLMTGWREYDRVTCGKDEVMALERDEWPWSYNHWLYASKGAWLQARLG